MKIVAEEKREEFSDYMETVACVIYKESVKNITELGQVMPDKEVISNSKEIGLAAGQIVLDKVIDLTKDMTRDELVIYLAETSALTMISMMNNKPMYRQKIQFLSKL